MSSRTQRTMCQRRPGGRQRLAAPLTRRTTRARALSSGRWCATVQICKCANVQMGKCANVQMGKCAALHKRTKATENRTEQNRHTRLNQQRRRCGPLPAIGDRAARELFVRAALGAEWCTSSQLQQAHTLSATRLSAQHAATRTQTRRSHRTNTSCTMRRAARRVARRAHK